MLVGYCSGCGEKIEHVCSNDIAKLATAGYCTRCGERLPDFTVGGTHLCNLAKLSDAR